MHTAHHILIYGCKFPGFWQRDSPRAVWDCGKMGGKVTGYHRAPTCAKGSQIIYAWARDAPKLVLPDGVGFKVGGPDTGISYLVLQVHYANVDKFLNGATDNSGVILSTLPATTEKVNKRAGILLLGTGGTIPAHREEHMETACPIKEPIILHPFAFRTHTHQLGKVVAGYVIRKNGSWERIGKHDPLKPQMFYPVNKDMSIFQGDIVAARCTMRNFRDINTEIGSTGKDEMCNFYMMYYVDGDHILQDKFCFTAGPPLYRWQYDLSIANIPQEIDYDASTLDEN
ncbi:peptidylglycine alpha-hydroxylating monooxygenase-like isoform X2 [Tachypleus tridentatus]